MSVDHRIDPVLREVIQSALDTAVEEGGLAAARAAGSPFISSSSGIACAVFDREGRQLAQTAGGLMHVSALRIMLREVLRDYPVEEIAAGDFFLLNDHFRGGIHPTDVGGFRAVFHGGRLELFVATMMIVSDLGGMSAGGLPANATEIFHEGLVIPVVRYYEAGRPVKAIAQIIRANSRAPEKVIGDIDALVAGADVAAARLAELLNRYGTDCVLDVAGHLVAYAEHMTRLGISAIPDGVYSGSYGIEEDGIETDREFVIRCVITIEGSNCMVDFAGTDRQARGPINSSYSQSLSAVVYAIRCYLDPYIPMNEGFYNVLDVRLPSGTLVNPKHPAACNLRIGALHAVLDIVNEAFGKAFPERVMAAGSVAATITISGTDSGVGGGTWTMLDVLFGVGGARQGLDAVEGTPMPIYSMSGWERSIEGYEWEYPVQYQCFRLVADSGGAGKWRGALAVMKKVHLKADGWLTVRSSDRFRRGPRGLAGGTTGSHAGFIVNEGTAAETRLPSKKTNHLIHAGDLLTFSNAGGGGLGNPYDREVEAVVRDVRAGFVSREKALCDYGVTVDDAGEGRRVARQ